MKYLKIKLPLAILLISVYGYSQSDILQSRNDVNGALLYKGSFFWSANDGLQPVSTSEPQSEKIRITQSNGLITLVREYQGDRPEEASYDSVVMNAKTLLPVYKILKARSYQLILQYSGKELKISRTRYALKKTETVIHQLDDYYFDFATIPFIVSCLPLSKSYQGIIQFISIDGELKANPLMLDILKVSDGTGTAVYSGNFNYWLVEAIRMETDVRYTFYMDKNTRRIMRTHVLAQAPMIDCELDINPIKAPFNKAETMTMITKGNSQIKGQAYTRAYDNKKNNILGSNKKQFAPKGSPVFLFPHTPYLKEYIEYNVSRQRSNTPQRLYPLPKETLGCTLVSEVIDDRGNFVFSNLKPGEYLVYVSYSAVKYTETTVEKTGGYSISVDAYGNGSITPHTITTDWFNKGANITSVKIITVKKEGEVVEITLKE